MAAAKKKEKKPTSSGASSGHITKLKQPIILRCLCIRHVNECSVRTLTKEPVRVRKDGLDDPALVRHVRHHQQHVVVRGSNQRRTEDNRLKRQRKCTFVRDKRPRCLLLACLGMKLCFHWRSLAQ